MIFYRGAHTEESHRITLTYHGDGTLMGWVLKRAQVRTYVCRTSTWTLYIRRKKRKKNRESPKRRGGTEKEKRKPPRQYFNRPENNHRAAQRPRNHFQRVAIADLHFCCGVFGNTIPRPRNTADLSANIQRIATARERKKKFCQVRRKSCRIRQRNADDNRERKAGRKVGNKNHDDADAKRGPRRCGARRGCRRRLRLFTSSFHPDYEPERRLRRYQRSRRECPPTNIELKSALAGLHGRSSWE